MPASRTAGASRIAHASRVARTLAALGALVLAPVAVAAGALALALPAAGQDPPRAASQDVKITWYGQACFELDFPTGLVVLVDPYGDGIGTYRFPKHVKPDVVTISHEHFDHNNDKGVAGKPQVLRGLTSADKDKQDWNKHDLVVKGVHIRSYPLYHDEKNGSERGKNAAFIFEPASGSSFPRIIHLGDLGHTLTDDQVKAMGLADVLLVPVGGHFTIDAAGAKKVADQLANEDRFVIPMHYKTPALKPELPLATAEPFLALWPKEHVKAIEGNEWMAPIPPTRRIGQPSDVLVLGYEPTGGKVVVKEGDVGKGKGAPVKLELGEARAWVDSMGGKKSLHVSFEVNAQAGPGGAKLRATATLDGKAIALEDGDANAPQPEGGFGLKAGVPTKMNLVAKEGQDLPAAAGGKVDFKVELIPTGETGGPEAHTQATIQDVR